jgi:hypothetical protein
MAQLTEAELANEIWMFIRDIPYSMAEQMAHEEMKEGN